LIFSKSTRRDIEIHLMKAVLAFSCIAAKIVVKALGLRLDGGCTVVKTYTVNYTVKVHSKWTKIIPAKSAHPSGLRILVRVVLTATGGGYGSRV